MIECYLNPFSNSINLLAWIQVQTKKSSWFTDLLQISYEAQCYNFFLNTMVFFDGKTNTYICSTQNSVGSMWKVLLKDILIYNNIFIWFFLFKASSWNCLLRLFSRRRKNCKASFPNDDEVYWSFLFIVLINK